MTKLFILSCLFSLLISCENSSCPEASTNQNQEAAPAASGCTPTPETTPTPVPTPAPSPDPSPLDDVPQEATNFDAAISFFKFELDDEEKVLKAIEVIKKVVASREFRNRIINFTYQGKKQFVDNKGLTNGQIYQILLNGSEDLKPESDSEMDLELELYYSSRNTVGYTYPNVLRIYMNRKFFDVYTPAEVAGNVFHEWTHKLGFDHASSYSTSRDSSVPYAIGYLIEELGKKYE